MPIKGRHLQRRTALERLSIRAVKVFQFPDPKFCLLLGTSALYLPASLPPPSLPPPLGIRPYGYDPMNAALNPTPFLVITETPSFHQEAFRLVNSHRNWTLNQCLLLNFESCRSSVQFSGAPGRADFRREVWGSGRLDSALDHRARARKCAFMFGWSVYDS